MTRENFGDFTLIKQGKVRDIYSDGERLLIVASDRISAFDYVLPSAIPAKGKVLNKISCFWFDLTASLVRNHKISCSLKEQGFSPTELDYLEGRAMLAKKTEVIPFECVVRGYLAGSAWKEYQEKGEICGIKLPEGFVQAQKLPRPIFTPATKAEKGHDENVSFEYMAEKIGEKKAGYIKEKSLALYEKASLYAQARGIIIADTKFEFGIFQGEIILIDEALTPDSSRFWPENEYRLGISPPSFDKQFVRDYLSQTGWDKKSPPPPLPEEIIKKTKEKYLKALELLTGEKI